MNTIRFITSVFCVLSFSLFAEDAMQEMTEERFVPAMESESRCLTDDSVPCYCSQSCSWRDKQEGDNPQYIEDDEKGHHCYCKQWDKDLYEANCEQSMDVPQPEGAK